MAKNIKLAGKDSFKLKEIRDVEANVKAAANKSRAGQYLRTSRRMSHIDSTLVRGGLKKKAELIVLEANK